MGDQRDGGIAWTDETWNPLRGCSKVSAGCANCYAEGMAARFSGPGMPFEGLTTKGHWNGTVRLVEEKLTAPLRWKRPRRVFVTSVSDPFHPSVTDEMLDRIFAVMALAQQHTFQLLTKRPERMREYLAHSCGRIADAIIKLRRERGDHGSVVPLPHIRPGSAWWPLPNVWLGVSVEDQAAADERIPHLLATPAAVRFLSCEPLLGPVDIAWAVSWNRLNIAAGFLPRGHFAPGLEHIRPLDWVIAGGESGPKARPMHPDWARGLRDQCKAAEVPFLFKQNGEYRPTADGETWVPKCLGGDGTIFTQDGQTMRRVGKKAAGRLLDGVLHDAFPAKP